MPSGKTVDREAILQAIVNGYEESYKSLTGDWQDLDRKAQAMAAVSGIFVGGIFAFLRETGGFKEWFLRALLLAATMSLLASIGYVLRVLKTRAVPFPVFGRHLEGLGADLLDLEESEFTTERYEAFMWDQIISWRGIDASLSDAKGDKAKNLWRAQLCLSIGVLFIALLAASKLLVPEGTL